jgi:hypothetical protein
MIEACGLKMFTRLRVQLPRDDPHRQTRTNTHTNAHTTKPKGNDEKGMYRPLHS